jgi:hypothetical protein
VRQVAQQQLAAPPPRQQQEQQHPQPPAAPLPPKPLTCLAVVVVAAVVAAAVVARQGVRQQVQGQVVVVRWLGSGTPHSCRCCARQSWPTLSCWQPCCRCVVLGVCVWEGGGGQGLFLA